MQTAPTNYRLVKELDELKLAMAISEYLHALDGMQPLVWHQARGLAERIAEIVMKAMTDSTTA